MVASIVIICVSLLLFIYWFRYTCLLILSAKTTRDYTAQVAKANRLELPAIQADLKGELAPERMEGLSRALSEDYRLLTGLLRHAAEFQVGNMSIEQRMLMIDFKVMKLTYAVARRFSNASQARQALLEMTDIVAHFANLMGERAAETSRL